VRGRYACSNQLPQRLPIDVPNTTQVDKQELAPCPFMLGNQLGRPAFTVADHSKDLSEASTTESLTDTPYALVTSQFPGEIARRSSAVGMLCGDHLLGR